MHPNYIEQNIKTITKDSSSCFVWSSFKRCSSNSNSFGKKPMSKIEQKI